MEYEFYKDYEDLKERVEELENQLSDMADSKDSETDEDLFADEEIEEKPQGKDKLKDSLLKKDKVEL